VQVTEEFAIVQEVAASMKGQNELAEKEFEGLVRWQESKVRDLEGQIQFENTQRKRMTEEIKRLEWQVQSREEYVVQLENEAIYLRKEIKEAKFHNEKHGYAGFVGGLVQLRKSSERSKSKNLPSSEPSFEHRAFNVSNQGGPAAALKQDKGLDDLPSRDWNNREKSAKALETRKSSEPRRHLYNQTRQEISDARRRLQMAELK